MAKLTDRKAGILLHPSSLPSRYGIGDFGQGAYRFIDFLAKAGQGIWQVLPFGPTGYGDSPYQSFSAFAGQPLFISPDLLANDGLLAPEDLSVVPDFSCDSVDYGWVQIYKHGLYHKAFDNFVADCAKDRPRLDRSFKKGYDKFREENAYWLDDYALFMAIKDSRGGVSFFDWPEELRRANADKRRELAGQFEKEMGYYFFIQYLFFKQWSDLKKYANEHGVSIVGDIPIFVSMDSADVWAGPELFQLDSKGYPTVVAGVPPDYFSKTGQLWGNPLYDWKYHKKTGYDWWKMRIRNQLKVFDYIRIDHFRGFEAYWAVPYGDENAIGGKWCKGPDHDFFESLTQAFGRELPIWAEDLGIITDEVEALRDDFGLPGMKVLQFAFDASWDSIYLPHKYSSNTVVYTGTHDNETTRGWFESLSEYDRKFVQAYTACKDMPVEECVWALIRTAMSSVSDLAVIPMQDYLELGGAARTNTPGTLGNNWQWRMTAGQATPELAERIAHVTKLYGRSAE